MRFFNKNIVATGGALLLVAASFFFYHLSNNSYKEPSNNGQQKWQQTLEDTLKNQSFTKTTNFSTNDKESETRPIVLGKFFLTNLENDYENTTIGLPLAARGYNQRIYKLDENMLIVTSEFGTVLVNIFEDKILELPSKNIHSPFWQKETPKELYYFQQEKGLVKLALSDTKETVLKAGGVDCLDRACSIVNKIGDVFIFSSGYVDAGCWGGGWSVVNIMSGTQKQLFHYGDCVDPGAGTIEESKNTKITNWQNLRVGSEETNNFQSVGVTYVVLEHVKKSAKDVVEHSFELIHLPDGATSTLYAFYHPINNLVSDYLILNGVGNDKVLLMDENNQARLYDLSSKTFSIVERSAYDKSSPEYYYKGDTNLRVLTRFSDDSLVYEDYGDSKDATSTLYFVNKGATKKISDIRSNEEVLFLGKYLVYVK